MFYDSVYDEIDYKYIYSFYNVVFCHVTLTVGPLMT